MSTYASRDLGNHTLSGYIRGPITALMTWFTTWFGSPYYTLLYGHRDEGDARPWVSGIMDRLHLAPGSRVLDMGCGRGRHARCFVEAGMITTGIDLSVASIVEAERNVPGGTFTVHDMHLPFTEGAFDLVVCLFTSMGYGEDRRDDQRMLDNAVQALRPGGWFVFDFMNTIQVSQDLIDEECVLASGVRFHLTRRLEGRMVVKTIHVDDGGRTSDFEERVYGWWPEELVAMVERTGALVKEITDGPPFPTFDRGSSKRMVIWSQRPA